MRICVEGRTLLKASPKSPSSSPRAAREDAQVCRLRLLARGRAPWAE